jgi:hypothetical protein
MSPSVLYAVVAGVILLLLVVFLTRRRRKRGEDVIGELPASLYLASHTQSAAPGDGVRAAPRLRAGSLPPRSAWSVAAPQAPQSETVVGWSPPPDGKVTLLPGRLEPLGTGGAARAEIRFMRQGMVTRYTLGRGRGSVREHVQLSAATVSRSHAWMEFAEDRWRIGGVSGANPVIVNGGILPDDTSHELNDGDRIELGAQAFVFRQPRTGQAKQEQEQESHAEVEASTPGEAAVDDGELDRVLAAAAGGEPAGVGSGEERGT